MLRVGIIGARGYAGEELINILLSHPRINIAYLSARIDKPLAIGEIYPQFKDKLDLPCAQFDSGAALDKCDLFFLALPHNASMEVAPLLLKAGKKVIDLSADYRIKNPALYERWYKTKHSDTDNLKGAVYGLPELYPQEIRESVFVANPGCYPTAAILSLAPLLIKNKNKIRDIVIDAKSGYSGAGRKTPNSPFMQEIKDNIFAYKVDSHQHQAEMAQEFSRLQQTPPNVIFVPQVLSVERGILETIYACPAQGIFSDTIDAVNLYKDFYAGKPFVRIKEAGEFPGLSDVRHTNFCDIGLKLAQDNKTVIIISAIDNLLKGASGCAVQNMNLMCGFKETEGLRR